MQPWYDEKYCLLTPNFDLSINFILRQQIFLLGQPLDCFRLPEVQTNTGFMSNRGRSMELRMMDSHLDSVISLNKTCGLALTTVITITLKTKTAPIHTEGKCVTFYSSPRSFRASPYALGKHQCEMDALCTMITITLKTKTGPNLWGKF